ncbi:NFACT RNA binding domain-containing protein [Oceanobacillus profundus]|uniref:Rqc2 family fibronectin-binding protein n=1 Tax=Oceanobacillus TaxID=182709 RepID=UPI00203C8779|nr:NFACT RNA binding domain-containing protein [Oceanobacillus profundus]MCM3396280.1 NFACT family protein [Oceanobacillus profundus]MDO6449710.1 NFACT RNA binding domain-containing protein [Oceanobacillus profundus]
MPFDGIVTRAITEELQEEIVHGKINKIYQPTQTELVFTIRSQGKNHSLLFSVHPTYARFHLTEDTYTNPKEPPMFCMVLRKHLSGAIVEAIEQFRMERIVTFTLKTRNEIGDISHKLLVVELMGKHSNVMIVDKEKGHIIDSIKHISMAQNRYRTILPGQVYKLPPSQNKLNPLEIDGEQLIRKLDFNAGKIDQQMVGILEGFSPLITKEIVARTNFGSNEVYIEKFAEVQQQLLDHDYTPAIYRAGKEDFHVIPISAFNGETTEFQSVNKMLDSFFSGKAERDRVKQQAKDLYRFIKNEKSKNERKLKKHQQTIKKAEKAEHYQKMGELLTAHMHLVKQGDPSINVIDYYDPDQRELTIELNPNKSPSENAQGFYKTYQKLKNSKRVVEKEIIRTEEEINYVNQLLQQIDVARVEDIEGIREELREEGYLKKQKFSAKHKNKPRIPEPETYMASDGTIIVVGKNNKQNEYATMKLAHRDDTWLHTKDIPGSHVIIRAKEYSEQTLLEAAELAAYFSKSQNSSSVPVDYTKIRHVKKPNGAKPGYVTYDNQKTIYVTPSKDTVDKLSKKK